MLSYQELRGISTGENLARNSGAMDFGRTVSHAHTTHISKVAFVWVFF